MLNISEDNVGRKIDNNKYSVINKVESKISGKVLSRLIFITLIIFVIILFFPWTQNIRSYGSVTTLKPSQRPQNINSVIAGQIDFWYVKEGDMVEEGDTILKISEVKDAYFDPELLSRTQDQIDVKEKALVVYEDKIENYKQQMVLLEEQFKLKQNQTKIKLQQAELKAINDSGTYEAAKTNLEIAEFQFVRQDSLYELGLKSLTDLEKRKNKLQESRAKSISALNKWLNSKNELISLQLEINNLAVKFQTDFNKIQSEIFTAQNALLEAANSLTKLRNQFTNYEFRNGLYYIAAPQDGYVTKMISNGIGETIKEGAKIATLMPRNYDLAVEIYVEPIDLPLVSRGRKVRIQFDGWPAIIFSGWPNVSHGTYGGRIYAIDQYISANGKYRVLVEPDPDDYDWPDALRYGSGTNTFILLDDVPIWYELWRQINGFPPDYYKNNLDMDGYKPEGLEKGKIKK